MMRLVPPPLGRALRPLRSRADRLAGADPAFAGLADVIQLVSSAFPAGGAIPVVHTDDGPGLSPPLEWVGVPPEALSLALLVEDQDSPTPRPLVHAVVIGLAPRDAGLAAGALSGGAGEVPGGAATIGRNSFLKRGWLPPDPPPGHGPHRYVFQLFALDRVPDLARTPGRGALVAAMRGHVLASGTLTGCYERP